MKLAIQKTKNSFFEEWVSYCENINIDFKIVDYKSADFISEVLECNAFIWHHQHSLPHDIIVAKEILYALQTSGVLCFPGFYDNWHFDDKLAQSYLFSALNIKAPKTYVFYSHKALLEKIDHLTFPVVFKLRNGAGSRNVKLIKDKNSLIRMSKKIHTVGIRQYDAFGGIKEVMRKLGLGKANFKDFAKAIAHLVYPLSTEKVTGRAWGYLYFQEYVKSECDYRVIVIDKKAFAIRRNLRENDFRASGSGFILYDKELFDDKLIKLAFDLKNRIKSDCVAFDFVKSNEGYVVLEISYGWNKLGYLSCPGYWDDNLNWIEGSFNPYAWMIDLIMKKLEIKNDSKNSY